MIRAAACAGCGLWLTVALCSPASAAVTIGPTAAPDPATSQAINFPSPSVVFNLRGDPSTPLLSPISGVVTRWRFYTGAVSDGASLQLRVLTPEGGQGYRMARSGPVEVLQAGGSGSHANLHAFSSHVPILAGQAVGAEAVHNGTQFLTVTLPQDQPASSPWAYGSLSPPPPDGSSGTATFVDNSGMGSDLYIVLSADIELDADGDGYGDESQDLCPTDPITQGACPPGPDTTKPGIALSGVPASMSMRGFLRGVRATVTPDEPVALEAELAGTTTRARVSAFNLRLAAKSAKLAPGARTLRLRPRRSLLGHPRRRFRVRLRITAADAAGNATVVTKKFRVRPRR